MNKVGVVLIALLLSGCGLPHLARNIRAANEQERQAAVNAMNAWIGRSRAQLVAQWGSPTSVLQDGAGEIYVYTKTETNTSVTPPVVANQGGNRPPITIIPAKADTTTRIISEYVFALDGSGTVRSWSRRR